MAFNPSAVMARSPDAPKTPTPAKVSSGVLKSTPTVSGSSGGASSTAKDSSMGSRPTSTSALVDSADSGTSALHDKELFKSKIKKLLLEKLPQRRLRSSSMPDAMEHVAGLTPVRGCNSMSCSGTETPIDYAVTPAGLGSPKGKPKPIVRTLSYLDLAKPGVAKRASFDPTASMDGGSEPGSEGSSVLTLARTWAHDLSSKKNAAAGTNDAYSGVSPATSASSPLLHCTPAKVSIVVQVELMSDEPLLLRPLPAVPEERAAGLEPSTFEQAAAFKRSTSLRDTGQQQRSDTTSSTSTAVGGATPDRGSTPAEKEKPAE